MSGSISFSNYPTNQRTHGVFAEIDPQNDGGGQNFRTLILGQKKGAGSAAPNVPVLAIGVKNVQLLCGPQSVISLMYSQYVGQDSFGEVWTCPQADDPSGVAAVGTVVFAGTATAAGTLSFYIGGVLVALPVAVGATAATIAASFVTAINAISTMPATATSTSATLTLTMDNAGVVGNDLDLRFNYLGPAGLEALPAGITATVTQMTGGANNPTTGLSASLANLGDTTFDIIVCPYTDTVSLNLLAAFLNATTGRWSWQQQLYGGVWTAYRGTAGALATFGNSRDEYTAGSMGFYDSPTPAWLWAADLAGAAAVSLRADPGLPLQELALNVLAPPVASRFPISVRNTLLFDGISTFVVNAAGTVIIDRMITFYQTDAGGNVDDTWLNMETPYSLVDIVRDMRSFLVASYGRKKLVADGSNIPGGSNLVTSQTILASAIGRYKLYCDQGRAQNYAAFKAGAIAENAGGGRVNLNLPFVLISQLRQIVMKVSFIANS